MKGKVGVQFREARPFGAFCEQLANDEVEFSLAGRLMVVLALDDYNAASQRWLKWATRDDVRVFPIKRGEKRPQLLSRERTQEVLRELARPR